jgi:hypothetical protein
MYPRSDTPHGWECPDSIICMQKLRRFSGSD